MNKSKTTYEHKDDYRCPCCRRLLFKAKMVTGIEIKCPKCSKLITINTNRSK